jgi:hypothetical protein
MYVLTEGGRPSSNLTLLDTWRLPPLATTDVLLPFVRPPDAHPWPPSDPGVFTRDLSGAGTRGMVYPMHCHMELSQIANGGNYPHGLLTHWVLTGDLDPNEQPTEQPTEGPTETPTEGPTETPTEGPTETPTEQPTGGPNPPGKPPKDPASPKGPKPKGDLP